MALLLRRAGDRWRLAGVPVVAALLIGAALALWFHGGSSGAGTAPQAADHPVATVRGTAIMDSVYQARLRATVAAAQQAGAPQPGSPGYDAFLGQMRARVLRSLVFDTVIAQEAAAHHVLPSEADVQAEIDADTKAAGGAAQLQTQLAEAGGGMVQLRDETRSRLDEANLVDALGRARAADIVARIRSGLRFEDAARQLSDDAATRDRGGDLGSVSLDLLRGGDPAFLAGVLALPAGQTSATPIRDSQGYEIVRVDGVTPSARSLHVIRVAAPRPYTVKERPDWFSAFVFLDIQADCAGHQVSISREVGPSPCDPPAAAPAPSPSPAR